MTSFESRTHLIPGQPSRPATKPVRAAMWFAVACFVALAVNTLVFSFAVSGMVERRILQRDANVSAQFVNSIVGLNRATSYFRGGTGNSKVPEMEAFFVHLAELPDVLGSNVYGEDRTVLWSSDVRQTGQRFASNVRLEAAFRGEIHSEIESLSEEESQEDGHVAFPAGVNQVIETYIPIRSDDSTSIVGAVEVYRSPNGLLKDISAIRHMIWLGSSVGAVVLFATLVIVMIVVRRILADQERRMVEAEKYAVVGELTSAVAHGLRNPLAAIRSSAELAADDDLPQSTRSQITDIIAQTDRLEGWIRSFLLQARETAGGASSAVVLDDVIRECLHDFGPQAAARRIVLRFQPTGTAPLVRIRRAELCQIINSIIANSMEAIGRDGEITMRREALPDGRVALIIEDNGPGIAPDIARRLFHTQATGKANGLGIGLSLTKRLLDRRGGTIELANRNLRGARATLHLPV